MQKRKHKRKMNHVVIVTSDAVDANVKQFRIRPWILQIVILVLCVIIGTLIGYLNYEKQIWSVMNQKNVLLQESISKLEGEKEVLVTQKQELETLIEEREAQLEERDEQILILSETVNQKIQSEKELLEELESQSIPEGFPLTGLATVEDELEDDYTCIFNTSAGSTVVATANGIVTAVNDDVDYGHSVWIDHGNGYITVYKNKGDVTVQKGDSVVRGSTLFVVKKDDLKLRYQMKKDGEYINPMDILTING